MWNQHKRVFLKDYESVDSAKERVKSDKATCLSFYLPVLLSAQLLTGGFQLLCCQLAQ